MTPRTENVARRFLLQSKSKEDFMAKRKGLVIKGGHTMEKHKGGKKRRRKDGKGKRRAKR
jgi:hypothetical protein